MEGAEGGEDVLEECGGEDEVVREEEVIKIVEIPCEEVEEGMNRRMVMGHDHGN